jgi:hypothetical protein
MLPAGPVVAAVVAVAAIWATAMVVRTYLVVPRLASVAPMPHDQGPRVSVVVAARNEARHIRAAVASLLAQDYHDLELIVAEDRSEDATGTILDGMAAKTPRLAVIHIRELPAGWLGKNHALHAGAARATGTVLLFVDGDVVVERTAVSRAVAELESGADHVTVAPQMDLPSRLLQAVAVYFLTWGVIALRIWRVNDPRSSASVGVGAFNMVRRSAYDAVGGHTRIAMRPDDDLMLGKVLRRSGARQRVLFGVGLVGVEWYRTLREATDGLRKNAFAALHYSVALALAALVLILGVGVWPFVAVWITAGAARLLYLVAALALMAGYALTAREQRMPLWLTLLYPVAGIIQIGMVALAVTRTVAAGGIEWRGTFYPLEQLRANRV